MQAAGSSSALETSDNWYEASLNPIKVDTHDDDGEAKDYVNSVIDSIPMMLPASCFLTLPIIQYPAGIVTIRTKLSEITLQVCACLLPVKKNIDDECG